MIALDANTALRVPRDAKYDIEVLVRGLAELACCNAPIHFFKYADGKVLPMASAVFVRTLVQSFRSVVLEGQVVLAPSQGGLLLSIVRAQRASLQAHIPGGLLQYEGDGPVEIRSTKIKSLVVHGLLKVAAAQSGLGADRLESVLADVVSAEEWKAEAAYISQLTAGRGSVVDLLLGSLATRPQASYTPNAVPVHSIPIKSYGGVVPVVFGFDSTVPFPSIALSGTAASFAPLGLSGLEGTFTVQCELPIAVGGSVEQRLASTETTSLQPGSVPKVPKELDDLILWPLWFTTLSGLQPGWPPKDHTCVWSVEVPAACIKDPDCHYAVPVENQTGQELQGVANAWQFSVAGGSAKAVVLNRITIPPYSCIEFLFSYDATANCGYMSPSRALNV